MGMTFCCAEDRKGAEIGLKLLVLSLAEHSPGIPLILYRPNPLPEFAAWLQRYPQVQLVTEPLPGANCWNTKPHALLPWLRQEGDEAVWLDSDIVVTHDPRLLFESLDPNMLAVTEEPASHPDPGMRPRTEAWGLTPGPERGIMVNSCFIRATYRHRQLLERWRELMQRPDYLAWQARTVAERPPAMKSDQDILNALLGSDEFQHLPIRLLRTGKDVVHCGGALAFSLGERLKGLFLRQPTILHAISVKPWMILFDAEHLRGRLWWWRKLNQEMSPYVAYVRRYRHRVDEPTPWLGWRTPFGTILRILGLGHWALRGLPVTAAASVVRRLGLLQE